MMEPTGTVQEIADLCGLLARATGGWKGTRNANWVLHAASMPSLSGTIGRLREIFGDRTSMPAAVEDDGA